MKPPGSEMPQVVVKCYAYAKWVLERRLIKPVWTYVIGDAINRGLLPPIEGWWKISSVPPKRVTVDAGREAQQNRADVEMGLKTLSDHFQELGADFGEEIERRASDAISKRCGAGRGAEG
jgi:capsid protein